MIRTLKRTQANYIFNIIAIIILVGSLGIYYLFYQTKQDIEIKNLKSNINYIDNVTDNIAELIKSYTNDNIYETLQNNIALRKQIEDSLGFFITDRYKYIYVVDKKDPNSEIFRFLLDGSKDIDEKSEFEESYIPFNIEKWNKVYKTKKEIYFKHNKNKSIWITYLKPILMDGNVGYYCYRFFIKNPCYDYIYT
jgi:type II secretory pathway pseudopilin PulG